MLTAWTLEAAARRVAAAALLLAGMSALALSTAPRAAAVDSPSAPICRDVSASTALSQPVDVKLDCSTGGGTRTYELASQPAHGRLQDFDAAAGTVRYIPNTGFRGDDSFTVRARNEAGASAEARATITVTPNPNEFTIVGKKRNRHKGIVALSVSLPGPGTLEILASKSVKRQVVDARAAGEEKITVRANGRRKKKLKRKRKVKVPVYLVFSPTGGDQRIEYLKVNLKRKRRG